MEETQQRFVCGRSRVKRETVRFGEESDPLLRLVLLVNVLTQDFKRG